MKKNLYPFVLVICMFYAQAFAQNQAAGAASFFDYDRAAAPALDVKEIEKKERDGAQIIELTYASPKGGRVPALLVLPKKKKALGAVLYQHGLGETTNKNSFLTEAIMLASRHKIAALLIDAPFMRPAEWRTPFGTMRDRDLMVQNVIDWRRGIDLLETREELDAANIAFVGHSYGGRIAGMLTGGNEPRLKAFVIMASIADTGSWMRTTKAPPIKALRENLTPEIFEKYISLIDPIEPKNFLGKTAPVPIFFQFATLEEYITREQMKATAALASEPKEVRFYVAPHDLNIEAFEDRLNWLAKKLKKKG